MWPDEVHVKLGFFLPDSSRSDRNSSLEGGDSSPSIEVISKPCTEASNQRRE